MPILKTILVTVSDDRMGRKDGRYEATQQLIHSLPLSKIGITNQLHLTWPVIQALPFYAENEKLLRHIDPAKNGRAYKPFAVQQALDLIDDGDFCIYSDCSPEMWASIPSLDGLNVKHLHHLCEEAKGFLVCFVEWDTRPIKAPYRGIHTHGNFTLNRCINRIFNSWAAPKLFNSFMCASGMLVIQKRVETLILVDDWLRYNLIDECCAMGSSEIREDYSFWNSESRHKMGHRHDQSILSLLLNEGGYRYMLPLSNSNPYNFLNYCAPQSRHFIDPCSVPIDRNRIMKGDKVKNQNGHVLEVFEVWPENGTEVYHVGFHEQSLYKTTADKLTKI